MIGQILVSLWFYFVYWAKIKWKKSWTFIHEDAVKLLEGFNINLPYCYARNMSFLYITLTYFGGMPVLIYFFSVYMWIQYTIDKVLIFKTCTKSHSMNYFPTKILLIGLLIHFAFSGWFYTSPGIFGTQELKWYQIWEIFKRFCKPLSLPFFILFILLLLFIYFKKTIWE